MDLEELLRPLGDAVAMVGDLRSAGVDIGSVVLLDGDDLDRPAEADLCLLAGVDETAAASWLDGLADAAVESRPRALMTRTASSSAVLAPSARRAGVSLVRADPAVRWDRLLATLSSILDDGSGRLQASPASRNADTDLFGLAQTVAALTRGMVSIEDDRAHVLAYSASDDTADELRRLSILGREGPVGYLRYLREQGVYDRLRQPGRAVDVPADPDLGIRRRLVIGVHSLPDLDELSPRRRGAVQLGAIWVQEGQQPLAADSESVLRGAAAVAGRLITRTLNAPSNEAVQIQRLLGARGGGVDIPSLASALSIPRTGPAVVIGLVRTSPEPQHSFPELVEGPRDATVVDAVGAVRLHASAYAEESLVTTLDDRIYVLLPRVLRPDGVPAWVTTVIERVARTGVSLRAAVAAPVAQLADVAAARAEVDRVLDGTTSDQRVTTLADSRTPVLLGEIFDLIGAHPELRDPRIAALTDYDARHGTALRLSVEEYLGEFGDVRQAAAQLQVHPNTLRYRIRRAEGVLGLDLTDPAARLLVELQLGVLRRTTH